MKLLILGGGGMLGHALFLIAREEADAWVTFRDRPPVDGVFEPDRTISGVRAEEFDTVVRAFATVRPDVVVNCIGVVKQRGAAKDPITSLGVNSLFPHRVAALSAAAGARLIHISTDCVFSGSKGRYRETDPPDATDLYGRSKQLGEVEAPGCITLRTSMIGRELATSQGLVEWFLTQGGHAPGYTRAIFSGLTTAELSRVLLRVIDHHRDLTGLYHVAAQAISKYDLLRLLNDAMGRGVAIEPDPSVEIDRSLDGSRFAELTGYVAPPWERMVAELAAGAPAYDGWRKQHAG
jgi:dTDP-4-dehydrorhamnose reductase